MTDLTESPEWGSVYQLETVDPVLGGPGGISNAQAQALANRDAYLARELHLIAMSNWTLESAGLAAHEWRGVACNPVAGGAARAVVVASDGYASALMVSGWVAPFEIFGLSGGLHDVHFGGGLWVAVGDVGAIQSSTGGTVWTSRTHAGITPLGNLRRVCRIGAGGSGESWVAVGSNGLIVSSADGITWTVRVGAGGYVGQWEDVLWADGIWVLVGANMIQTSVDGVNFVARAAGSNFRSIAYRPGEWFVSGTGATVGRASATADDWTFEFAVDITTMLRLAYHERSGLWVGIEDTLYPDLRASADGVAWRRLPVQAVDDQIFAMAIDSRSSTIRVAAIDGAIFSSMQLPLPE